jgi:hypothetical protein
MRHDKLFRLLARQGIILPEIDITTTALCSAHLSHETNAHIRCLTCGKGHRTQVHGSGRFLNRERTYEDHLVPAAAHTKGRFVEGYTCFCETCVTCRERMVEIRPSRWLFRRALTTHTHSLCLLLRRYPDASTFSWANVRPRRGVAHVL